MYDCIIKCENKIPYIPPPQGCKNHQECEFFKEIIIDYCDKHAVRPVRYNEKKVEELINCFECKYVEICNLTRQLNFLEQLRKNSLLRKKLGIMYSLGVD